MVHKNASIFSSVKYRNIDLGFSIIDASVRISNGCGYSKMLISANTKEFRNRYSTIYSTYNRCGIYSIMKTISSPDNVSLWNQVFH